MPDSDFGTCFEAPSVVPFAELRFSNLLESSSNTLLLASNLCTMADGWLGLRSRLNLRPAEAAVGVPVDEDAAVVVAGVETVPFPVEPRTGGADEISLITEAEAALLTLVIVDMTGAVMGVAGVEVAGVDEIEVGFADPDHSLYFSSRAFSRSSRVMLAGSMAGLLAAETEAEVIFGGAL